MTTHIERAAKYREAGLTIREVAEVMGTSRATVSRYLAHGRVQGIVPPSTYHVSTDPRYLCKMRDVTYGGMGALMEGLSDGAMTWIIGQTQEGGKVVDVIVDYIEDAYLENLEKERARDG